MDKTNKKRKKKNIPLKNAVVLTVVGVTAALALLNFKTVTSMVAWLVGIFSPFLIGLGMAFVVNIIMSALENRVFKFLDRFKFWQKIRRAVCVVLSLLLFFGIIVLLCLLILPQLRDSLMTLGTNMPYYIESVQFSLNRILEPYNISIADIQYLHIDWQSIIKSATDIITNLTPQVATVAAHITAGIFNVLMGIFFAIYMLFGKEKIFDAIHRTWLAFFGKKKTSRACEIMSLSNRIFKNFIVGQLTEVLILGVLYFIFASIFRMPYAILLSAIMAIGGLIPMFGPIISTIPCVLILLMINPASALVFVIMAIVIQQLESNFIYPFVVGDSIGLPAIWVLLSILVGGELFGPVGMVLAVPITSVLYALLRNEVNERLLQKMPPIIEEVLPPEPPATEDEEISEE